MGRLVFWILLLALAGHGAFYYPRLPERMASHFGAGGVANGWMAKPSFFTVEALTVGLVAGMFLLLPALVRRMPTSLVNLPNKDYWLAPERRAQSVARLGDQMMWCGALTLGFLLVLFQWTFEANLGPEPRLPAAGLWIAVSSYVALMIVWVVGLYRAFARPLGAGSSAA